VSGVRNSTLFIIGSRPAWVNSILKNTVPGRILTDIKGAGPVRPLTNESSPPVGREKIRLVQDKGVSMRRLAIVCAIGLALPGTASAQGAEPAAGRAKEAVPTSAFRATTYCNPLSIPTTRSRSLADPTALYFHGRWYLYATGGQTWVSDDLVHWDPKNTGIPGGFVAPSAVIFKDTIYFSANGRTLLRSLDPLGPWENLGIIRNDKGDTAFWGDVMFFVDDDRRFYCYHTSGSGIGTEGIYVDVMGPASNFTRSTGPSVHCFAYVKTHVWERFGDANEFEDLAWIEGPWMTRHQGRYFLQYSGCGTEWKRYAVGVYTSDSPLGPFTYDPRSPLLREKGGLLNGTGHHCIVEGRNNTLWNVYHVLFHNGGKWDRRLALDPVGFDADNNMIIAGPSETPQYIPGHTPDPYKSNNAGMKMLSMNKNVSAGSSALQREPRCSVDNNVRTWWQAADNTAPQWLSVDLGDSFTVRAVRIILSPPANGGRGGKPGRGAQNAGSANASLKSCRFTVGISADQKTFSTVAAADDSLEKDIFYYEISPARARYVRLTITAGLRGEPAGVAEFSVFGH
jgi:xylan 1,4-beta-xylosidase